MSSEEVYMVYQVIEPYNIEEDDHWSDSVYIKAVTYDEKEAKALISAFPDYKYVHTTDTYVEHISNGEYEWLHWDSLEEFETDCLRQPYHIRIDLWRIHGLNEDEIREKLKPILDLVEEYHGSTVEIKRQC